MLRVVLVPVRSNRSQVYMASRRKIKLVLNSRGLIGTDSTVPSGERTGLLRSSPSLSMRRPIIVQSKSGRFGGKHVRSEAYL